MMTICDYPEYLALGYLLNQNMLRTDDRVTDIVYDDEIETVVVRTERPTDFEQKLKKKTLTSGCAQGTSGASSGFGTCAWASSPEMTSASSASGATGTPAGSSIGRGRVSPRGRSESSPAR